MVLERDTEVGRDQIHDPFRPMAVVPVLRDQVRVLLRDDSIVRCDDVPGFRVEQPRQLVIGNEAGGMPGTFSAGADLSLISQLCHDKKFTEIDAFIKKYCPNTITISCY